MAIIFYSAKPLLTKRRCQLDELAREIENPQNAGPIGLGRLASTLGDRMKKLIVTALIAFLICVTGALLFVAPIVPCGWSVTYQQEGGAKIQGSTGVPLFASDYVIVDLPREVSEGKNRIWSSKFMVSFDRERVLIPVAYRKSFLGISYVHRDQLKGADITGAKVDDGWTVSFEEERVTFMNGKITVTLHREA